MRGMSHLKSKYMSTWCLVPVRYSAGNSRTTRYHYIYQAFPTFQAVVSAYILFYTHPASCPSPTNKPITTTACSLAVQVLSRLLQTPPTSPHHGSYTRK
jgi:hypothetical protein